MGRKRSQKAVETAERLERAITTVPTGKAKSIYQAAKEYGVHRQTLANQLETGKTLRTARESQQVVSPAEERVLTKWCTHLTQGRYSVSLLVLKEMIETIIARRVFKGPAIATGEFASATGPSVKRSLRVS
jgi:hypothetical protein